jgi:hypothetical protein
MNPTLKDARFEREKRLDPLRFSREYEAEFSENVDSFLPSAWIEAAIVSGRHELPPAMNMRYVAAVDVSGLGSGSNPDAFTLNIVHATPDNKAVQDCQRGWRKSRSNSINLAGILAEIKSILTAYRLNAVFGDAYGKAWVSERFMEAGIDYVQVDHDKSFYYLQTEPLFAQGRVELLDNRDIEREFKTLERRMLPGGKIRIDHARSNHDDHSNSFAIAATLAAQGGLQGKQIISTGQRIFSSRSDWLGMSDRNEGSGINAAWDSGELFRKNRFDW